ncbi:hypothetical protein [Trinickia dinghuensis]|uniref:Uncharacterized protein n=1 Tax=Trinickia dinghuensis TaxID=2291023 RepID=A0A3D8K4K6_9BURK|nr:hypothetical protein [Trinickia dinghuensis]RDV00398.1 hypothetical protein DWV00_00935 [Trinickia dinghuensis]
MDVLDLAQHCGMQVTLDARIGREEYRSVYGSIEALQRFADALLVSIAAAAPAQMGPATAKKSFA